MADMIVQYRVMPESGEVEYETLERVTKEVVANYSETVKIKEIGKVEVGFGLQACRVKFQIDENCGSEALENKLIELEEVGDVNVELMDRL